MPVILINLPPHTRERVFHDDFSALETAGNLTFFDPNGGTNFPALVAAADAVLTGWGSRPITPDDLAGRDKPLLIAHAAGSARGVLAGELLSPLVRLTQASAPMAISVAQFTVGLMILAARQTLARTDVLRRGEQYDASFVYQDLSGLTVGLIGLSQVGRRVPPLLQPFGVGEILAYDPYFPPAQAESLGVTLSTDLDDLLRRSDIVSLHAPVTEETRNLLNSRRIGLLKTGGAFINTARPQIVDQDALFARAAAGEIQAYVDVTTPEPLPPEHPAWQSANIFVTPHIAGPTRQTHARIGEHAIAEILRFLHGRPLETEISAARYEQLA